MSSNPEFGEHTTAEQVVNAFKDRVNGKHFAITGGNSGLGKESARVLAKEGGIVYILCRDMAKGEAARKDILKETPQANITVMKLDLMSLQSIKEFSEEFIKSGNPLHVLLNNAGIMACPYAKTKDGFESQFGTNHIGHFYLTKLLLPVLESTGTEADPARVVALSSLANDWAPDQGIRFDDLNSEKKYNPWVTYGMSKLANLLFAFDMHNRKQTNKVDFVSLHPGVISTNLARDVGCSAAFSFCGARRSKSNVNMGLFDRKSIPEGTATSMVCALDPKIEFGKYYSDCQLCDQHHELAFNKELAEKLTDVTEKVIAEKLQQ